MKKERLEKIIKLTKAYEEFMNDIMGDEPEAPETAHFATIATSVNNLKVHDLARIKGTAIIGEVVGVRLYDEPEGDVVVLEYEIRSGQHVREDLPECDVSPLELVEEETDD